MSHASFQPSFFRFALKLPDSAPVRMLRLLAPEIFRQLGGEIMEQHLLDYANICARWRQNGEASPGLREAMRAMGARERGVARLEKLREQAWLQARAEVFQQTGERIELPHTPESAQRAELGQGTKIMRQLAQQFKELKEVAAEKGLSGPGQPTGSGAQPGPGPQPASPQTPAAGPQEPLTNKQIKTALQRLISAQVDRRIVQALRQDALAGRITKPEFIRRVEHLLGIDQAA